VPAQDFIFFIGYPTPKKFLPVINNFQQWVHYHKRIGTTLFVGRGTAPGIFYHQGGEDPLRGGVPFQPLRARHPFGDRGCRSGDHHGAGNPGLFPGAGRCFVSCRQEKIKNFLDRSLKAEISDSDWKARKVKWRPPQPKNAPGILGLFGGNAEQAHQGAGLVAHPAPWGKI
jgi:hypothetical protein